MKHNIPYKTIQKIIKKYHPICKQRGKICKVPEITNNINENYCKCNTKQYTITPKSHSKF